MTQIYDIAKIRYFFTFSRKSEIKFKGKLHGWRRAARPWLLTDGECSRTGTQLVVFRYSHLSTAAPNSVQRNFILKYVFDAFGILLLDFINFTVHSLMPAAQV